MWHQFEFKVVKCSHCRFASFRATATADAVLGYLIAFLVLLATVKLWHLMRLNSKLHMITATLQRAWTDISGFLVVITIMTLAYSIVVWVTLVVYMRLYNLYIRISYNQFLFQLIEYYFSLQFNLLCGWRLSSYKTLMEAGHNMVSLQLGIFNYDEVG